MFSILMFQRALPKTHTYYTDILPKLISVFFFSNPQRYFELREILYLILIIIKQDY